MSTEIAGHSTLSDGAPTLVECKLCRRKFTKRGINIHLARSHNSSQDSSVYENENLNCDVQNNSNIDLEESQNNEISQISSTFHNCTECGLSFISSRGLVIHKSKRHAYSSNKEKIHKILSSNSKIHVKLENQTESELSHPVDLQSEINKWLNVFKDIYNNLGIFNPDIFDNQVDGFLQFLFESNSKLPGPKHPATRYYEMRKKHKEKNSGINHKSSSNPQRTNTARRKRNQNRYEYELAQYNYFNKRKAVVRSVMSHGNQKPCPIEVSEIENKFHTIFGTPNENTRENYLTFNTFDNLCEIPLSYVQQVIKNMPIDTSPGNDRVLMRTVKKLNIHELIKIIADIMLCTNYVPKKLREGRTLLIYKGKGDVKKISSWRPITIYSVIRRIIEKVLDKLLRSQIEINHNQRGFMSNIAGCHINSKIINGCLNDAKQKKRNCVIAFLDISQAFDRIGHTHIASCLKAMGVSPDLQGLINNLLGGNTILIEIGNKRTKSIPVKCGVPQGYCLTLP